MNKYRIGLYRYGMFVIVNEHMTCHHDNMTIPAFFNLLQPSPTFFIILRRSQALPSTPGASGCFWWALEASGCSWGLLEASGDF